MAIATLVGTSGRAGACSLPEPPLELIGYPKPGARDVPTNALPIFGLYNAGISSDANLPLTQFELVSSSGETVPVTPRIAFTAYFELVPETSLEPATEYTIRVTAPPRTPEQQSTTLILPFTTGSGPLDTPAVPPDARIQHYHSSGTLGSSCDPGPHGSCVSFPESVVEVWRSDAPEYRRLIFFGAWSENLTGIDQGTPSTCLSLRTRAADGTTSDTVELCRDDGEIFSPPDTAGLRCTERGLEKNGVPLDGSGGTPTGGTGAGGSSTGGSTTGGAETGGTSAGGRGNSAGAPDDDGSRVVTEGCGCRVTAEGTGSAGLLFATVFAASILRRRRAGGGR